MAPPERMNIEQTDTVKHPFFGSVRMTYVICGFCTMIFHHALRSAINLSILCMVKPSGTYQNSTVQFVSSISDCNKPPIVSRTSDPHVGDLPWNRRQEVLFPSVFFYGYVLSLPIGGYFTDKYGGKALFISSLMIEASIFLLIPTCARSNFWLAVVVRAIQGFIGGLGNPALYSLFTTWSHPTERSASIAFGFAGFNVGNLLIYPIVGWVCSRYSWDSVYYLLGGVVFAAGFIMNWLVYNGIDDHPRISPEEYRYLKPSQSSKSKKHVVPWKSILTCVPVYAFIVTHFCHCVSMSVQALMLPRFFKEAMHFSIEESGFLTSAIFMGSLVTLIFSIIATAQIEKRPTVNLDLFHRLLQLVCCWTTLPFIIAIILLDCEDRWYIFGLWVIISAIADVAFSCGYWPTVSFFAPSYSGFIIGVANCIGTTSSVIVPFFISLIVPTGTAKEWDYGVALVAFAYFLDGLIFFMFGSTKLQPWGLKKETEDEKT